ncbi:MAG: porin family protein [Bacteroidota bacterium]|nr:porin family protein [Bacteroidota bacterium]MDX5448176.1 porin family protein [Bacteroidota bacterium]
MRRIFLLSAILAFPLLSFAQFNLKPHLGGNYGQLQGNVISSTFRSKPGYQLGLDVSYGYRFYSEAGLEYTYIPTEVTVINGPTFDLSASAIRIPLLIGFRFFDNEDFNIRIWGGASASYVLQVNGSELITKDDINSPIWGVTAGVGVDYLDFYLEAGYEIGVSRVFDESVDPNGVKNNVVYVNLGYYIFRYH